jgi:broad specificity phosphatase PhoE
MVKTIYFVRHGHYKVLPRKKEDNSEIDGPLTLMGIEKIVEVTHKIMEIDDNVQHIYTSPYTRARETANLMKRILKKPISVREKLHERHVSENTIEHFKKIFAEFELIVKEALATEAGTTIVVSHDLPLSLYISIMTGITYETITQDYSHLDLFKMGECIKADFENGKIVSHKKL